MRNLVEYPITTDEIVECLDTLIAGMLHLPNGEDVSFGDMRPLLLAKAKEIVLANASAQRAPSVDLLSVANELMQWHDACTQNSSGGDGQFRVECSSGSDAQARGLRGSLRRAAEAIRAIPAVTSTECGEGK